MPYLVALGLVTVSRVAIPFSTERTVYVAMSLVLTAHISGMLLAEGTSIVV